MTDDVVLQISLVQLDLDIVLRVHAEADPLLLFALISLELLHVIHAVVVLR